MGVIDFAVSACVLRATIKKVNIFKILAKSMSTLLIGAMRAARKKSPRRMRSNGLIHYVGLQIFSFVGNFWRFLRLYIFGSLMEQGIKKRCIFTDTFMAAILN